MLSVHSSKVIRVLLFVKQKACKPLVTNLIQLYVRFER